MGSQNVAEPVKRHHGTPTEKLICTLGTSKCLQQSVSTAKLQAQIYLRKFGWRKHATSNCTYGNGSVVQRIGTSIRLLLSLVGCKHPFSLLCTPFPPLRPILLIIAQSAYFLCHNKPFNIRLSGSLSMQKSGYRSVSLAEHWFFKVCKWIRPYYPSYTKYFRYTQYYFVVNFGNRV